MIVALVAVAADNFTVDRSDRPVGLGVNSSQTIALIDGNVNFAGGNITTEGGQIAIAAVRSGLVESTANDVGWDFNYDRLASFKDISLSQAASIEASGNGGGNVRLRGQNISITDGSAILADTLGDSSAE